LTPETQATLFPEPQEAVAARVDAQICCLLLGHPGGALNVPLEHNEREVLRMLRYMRGASNAVPIRAIENRTGLDPRAIKQAVRNLRLNFHLPIGSSKNSARAGYYVMVSPEDRAAWRKDVTDQIRAEVEVLRAADGDHAALEVLGQLALEVKA
jgi:DNA-binding MarR family transcriptional regulator